ncbi:hypothetical protein ACHQM5_004491 [Ranunculus cassubicifolius]
MASALSQSLSSPCPDILEIEGIEFSEIDGDLMMSLLEESLAEEVEDERLGSLIQSLEAEISQPGDDRLDDIQNYFDDCVSSNHDSSDSMDMEMASISSEDMSKWYEYSVEHETSEFGDFQILGGDMEKYSQFYCSSEDTAYSSLWQDTYAPVMYR